MVVNSTVVQILANEKLLLLSCGHWLKIHSTLLYVQNGVVECNRCSQAKPVGRIPDFMESLDVMRELHLKKNEDYAQDSNPFSNFDFTEYVLRQFHNDRE